MALLQPGDEIWTQRCDWCGRGIRLGDETITLDGSKICPSCVTHYDGEPDAPDGEVVVFISNINEEERIT